MYIKYYLYIKKYSIITAQDLIYLKGQKLLMTLFLKKL